MNPNEKQTAEKLLQKFANPLHLDGKDFTFKAYALTREDKNFKGNDSKNYFPPEFQGNLYFVAEVAINLNPRGGWSMYKHFFQLDLASIKIELDKIEKIDANSILFTPIGIANVIKEHYYLMADLLVDYNNERDDNPQIAALLLKFRGTAPGIIFGV